MRVLHVVRRFGPVGGMESYVWRLVHALVECGVDIEVLCQTIEGAPDSRIKIHRLAASSQRRRWKAMQDFIDKSDAFWMNYTKKAGLIVHSHERCNFHQVTTIHGPPMPSLDTLPWYKKISPRVRAWKHWEGNELLGSQVQFVVPVSSILRSELVDLHPSLEQTRVIVITPGMLASKTYSFSTPTKVLRCLFVGKEWRRKGLEKAIEILVNARDRCGELMLDVYGPEQSHVGLRSLPKWVRVKGFACSVPFANYDLLIHPASKEPFGMVVPEALSNGCRALVSDKVGASDLTHPALRVVDINADIGAWVDALERLVDVVGDLPFQFETWRNTAQSYISSIYAAVTLTSPAEAVNK